MRTLILAAAALSWAGAAQAQDHSGHSGHSGHSEGGGPALTEAGQGAFAALQEVVTRLSQDPSTDWSHVDVERLRQHLVDMDEVTLRATIRREDIEGGARFTVTGRDRTLVAIRNMVVGHARAMGEDEHWSLSTREIADGAVVTALGKRPEDTARIRALGLLGIIAVGAHHQPHHFMLATGLDPH